MSFLQDKFILETPGGGGYGKPGMKTLLTDKTDSYNFMERGSVFEYRKAQESV